MRELRLDFSDDDTITGFRLESFELYNWGTFNKRVVTLNLNGANGLLTGDIGSGKSTIVDAITTLLVPHNKIIYNKAAGAQNKERTLLSYIVGEYKSTQDEEFGRQKAVALRDSSNFSVLLARFYNKGYEESFSIAQFFYINNQGVQKIFVTSYKELSIKSDFFNFKDVKELKKRLKQKEHTKVFDSFKEYSKEFMRAMGIKNEQALNLFYQTVSLKSIGNLTSFIRSHMLEKSNIDEKIDELCLNFAELSQAYELVERARRQIEFLEPISKEAKKYRAKEAQKLSFEEIKDSLPLYIAKHKKELLDKKIDELEIEIAKKKSKEKSIKKEIEQKSVKLTELKIELEKSGGDRLKQIEQNIKELNTKLQLAKGANSEYNTTLKKLGFSVVSNEHSFLKVQKELEREVDSIEEKRKKLKNEEITNSLTLERYKEQKLQLSAEIEYLKKNPSNIPRNIAKIRDEMLGALNLQKHQLPFAGELIRVIDKEWQGAIERVLRGFSLSLLVDNKLYERVSEYVDKTNLKGKLIYLKVDNSKSYPLEISAKNSLLQKIEIKQSSFLNSLQSMLSKSFDIACVDNLEEFRRYKRAITKLGQVKLSFVKHEKDDRFDIFDKSRWTLGWDNEEKLKQLERDFKLLEGKLKYLEEIIEKNQSEQKSLDRRRDLLRDALRFKSFEEINWYSFAKEIESLKEERERIEKSSNILKTLQENIEITTQKLNALQIELSKIYQEIGRLEQILEDRRLDRNEALLLLENKTLSKSLEQKCDELKSRLFGEERWNLNSVKTIERGLKAEVDREISNILGILRRSGESILKYMGRFLQEFPLMLKEMDASLDSIEEFEKKHVELKKDNLPKWQKKFKELLKEKTIQNIVLLQSYLEEEANSIKEKIEKINQSLESIEYSNGTYIKLIASESKIAEIRQFRADLKEATSGSIGKDFSYDEDKFKQIKALIDRFNGREGFVDVDKKWRRLVTDVRNWFDFSAVERYMSDDSIKEYYAHCGGKSGEQKEKLAYTVLASSLAFQFGLEANRVKSKSFRFVVIDEAFGKGSDESSRYALRLFEKLRLQLLVVTPKQKINVIEPFVKSIHFVYNEDGMDSSLVSLEIEEYRKKAKL